MKLATLRGSGRDGALMVVDRRLAQAVLATEIAATLQHALDDWEQVAPALQALSERLEAGHASGAFAFSAERVAAPLPRAYQFLDASAYVNHVELVRKARGAEMPASFWTDPLMYQAVSTPFLGPRDPIPLGDEAWGLDFESEVAVITDDVPAGTSAELCADHIKLLCLLNDVSLRTLIPDELAKGFGFVHGKPPSALSEVAVTPDELGAAWRGCKVHLPLRSERNGQRFGEPDAGTDMTFDFAQLLAHAAKTRPLGAGTLLGSGTVSNRDSTRGFSCIAERRSLETLQHGTPLTRYLRAGERVRIEMRDAQGGSLFGAIDQWVVSR